MRSSDPERGTAGFTLLELIVVMAVLTVFLMITAVVSRDAIDLHGATKARLHAERDAAMFMRQFETDIAQRVARLEARANIVKQLGNDRISLVTQRQGYALHDIAADRRVSLVSYRIKDNLLERAASGYGYGSAPARPAEKAGTLALAKIPVDGPLEPDDPAFQVIATGVIRFELSFLVREAGKWLQRAAPPLDQQQIQQIIVTVAVLDPDRSRMLDAGQIKLIAAEFPDAGDDVLPFAKWSEIAAALTRRLPKIPHTALQQVRVYQAVCTLANGNPPP